MGHGFSCQTPLWGLFCAGCAYEKKVAWEGRGGLDPCRIITTRGFADIMAQKP